ncbi:MAG: hypothetical protein QXL57_00560 [Candidatus Bathyarchaeia archaeon]
MQTITKLLKKFKQAKRGVSNVIVVMLSLILIVLIVSNVVLWSYQMNQFDLERMQENVRIANVTRVTRSPWFTTKTAYTIERGSVINGTYMDTWTDDYVYEAFREEAYYSYNPFEYNPLGSTQYVSGLIIDLQEDDGVYMTFRSYASRNTTGTFGNTQVSSSTLINANRMYGSVFTSPDYTVIAKNITFYCRSNAGTRNVKCLIVRHTDLKIIAITNPVTVTTAAQWWTATFSSPPLLSPNTEYVLMIIPDNQVRLYYTTGSADQGHYDTSNSYSSPTDPTDALHNNYQYSIYCGYDKPIEYTVQAEFSGTSNTELWTRLIWTVDSCFTTGNVNVTLQLFNYDINDYPEDGDGYISYISSSTPNIDETKTANIISNTTYFRDAFGNWKLKITGVKATNTQFDLKVDFIELKTEMQDAYALSIIGEFSLDMSTYPLVYIDALEIQIRLRANDTSENWSLNAHNWTSGQYNVIGEITPTTDFEYYTINLTDSWQSYVNSNCTMRIKFCDVSLDANQTTIDIDFFAVRAVIDGASFKLRNSGSITTHIVSIWIINTTNHQRYNANWFVNAGEEAIYICVDISLPEEFIAKVVTERGNIAVFTKG